MARSRQIPCPSCGFRNEPPLADNRCVSCGAKIEDSRRSVSRKEDQDRRFRQEAFSPTWFFMSLVVVAVLTAAVVGGVPILVPLFDFEGSAGMLVSIPVWFTAGLLIGLISPGRTYMEPVVATFLIAMPTAILLYEYQTVKTMPAFMYVLMSALGLLFALIGTYVGERLQLGPPPKQAD